jgi:hypothetical protein
MGLLQGGSQIWAKARQGACDAMANRTCLTRHAAADNSNGDVESPLGASHL